MTDLPLVEVGNTGDEHQKERLMPEYTTAQLKAVVARQAQALEKQADDLAKQAQVIVRLLRKCGPVEVRHAVQELCKESALTRNVYEEVKSLLIENGLALPYAPIANTKEPLCYPEPQGPTASRFATDFEPLEVLGFGTFGEVWRARSRIDHKEYAIKAVPFHYNADENPMDHPALREAQTLASVTHQNLVRYHAAWVEGDDASSGRGTATTAASGVGWLVDLPHAHVDGVAGEDHPGPNDSTSVGSDFSSDDGSSGGIVFEGSRDDEQIAEVRSVHKEAQLQIVPRAAAQKRRAIMFVQMELVRGGSVRDWIERRNAAFSQSNITVDEEKRWFLEGLSIFQQCVAVLNYLGTQSVVHRDIKPSNIFLTEDGEVRLGDLGLAKKVTPGQEGGKYTLTKDAAALTITTGAALAGHHTAGVGTPAYASPEQMAKHYYGPETDMYSLGVVLAELLCPVQTQMERVKLIEGLRNGELPASTMQAYPDACRIILAMTSQDPSQRPSVQQMAQCMRKSSSRTCFGGKAADGHAPLGQNQEVVSPQKQLCDGATLDVIEDTKAVGADLCERISQISTSAGSSSELSACSP